MSSKKLAFHKTNLIICSVAVAIIVIGFILMSGPATTFEGFEPDIFSARRIKVAPAVTLVGFLLMIVGILYLTNDEKSQKSK